MSQQIVGEARVLIVAQDAGLESDIKGKVARALGNVKAEAKVAADTKPAEESIKGLAAKAGNVKAEAKVTADTTQAEGALGKLGGLVDGVVGKLQQFGVPTGALTALSGFLRSVGEAGGQAADGLTETAAAAEQSEGAMLDTTSAAATTAGTFGKLASRAATLGGIALVTWAVSSTRAFLGLASEVDNLQDVLGGTAEEASRFRNIGAALGVDTARLGDTVFKLSQNVAAKGDAFEKAGIQIAKNRDGTVNLYETVLNLSDAYNSIEDPQKRNVFLMETLGRSGKEMIDILAQGSARLREFAEGGPILDDADIRRAEEFRIEMKLLGDEVRLAGVGLGGFVVGPLTQFIRGIRELGNVETLPRRLLEAFNPLAGIKAFIDDDSKSLGDLAFAAARSVPVVGGLVNVTAALLGPQKNAGDAAREHARAQVQLERDMAAAEQAAEDQRRALEDLIAAQEDAVGTTQSLSGAHNRAWADALRVTEAEEDLAEALNEHGRGSREAEKAELSLEQARQSHVRTIDGLAKAQRDQEVTLRLARGETVTQAEKTAIYRQRLQELANTVSGPVQRELRLLQGTIREIPEIKNIDVEANTAQAEEAIRELIFLLGLTQQTAYIAVQIFGVENARAAIQSLRQDAGNVLAGIPPDAFRQHGGPMFPGGTYTVGEVAPERVRMFPGGGAVVEPVTPTSSAARQRAGAERAGDVSQVVNVVVNNPAAEPASVSLPRELRRAAAALTTLGS